MNVVPDVTSQVAASAAVAVTTPSRHAVVQPAHFPRPRGYANGVIASGRTLFVAGQVGWELDGSFVHRDLAGQLGRALDHIVDVVRAAGGLPTDIVRLTVYVTDLDEYRRNLPAIGAAWRARLGKHFPAMAVVGVAGLVEPRALIEIEATAVLEPH